MATAATSIPALARPIAIVWAGLLCGAMDITAALIVYGHYGAKPIPLLQGIAAGILGPRAASGGLATAALGLFLHFVIAFGAATVFFLMSQWAPILVQQALIFGPLYGIAVYYFMNRIVVPLSNARKFPFSLKMMIIGLVIHIFCVGLPIALVIRKFSAAR